MYLVGPFYLLGYMVFYQQVIRDNKLLVCRLCYKELIIVPSCSYSENNVYHGKSYLQSGVQSEKAVECRRKGFDSGRGLPEQAKEVFLNENLC